MSDDREPAEKGGSTAAAVGEDWWPDALRGLAGEDPWRDEMITVAEMAGYDDGARPGERVLWSALVTSETLAALGGGLHAFHHEVESTGRPGPDSTGTLTPGFRIDAFTEDSRITSEPLVLGWVNANRTAMVLDPGFCMTYGLMPRALADGSIRWDDPAAPQFDVAIVDPPSVYDNLRHSGARARVSRAHVQDYLTLRGMHLVQVYFEQRTVARDAAADEMLAGRDRAGAKLADRELDVIRNRDGSITAQVWGARLVAGPADLPVSADGLDAVGLTWPGLQGQVTHKVAREFPRMNDSVYVADTALAAYEGRPGFDVHPESGAVSFGGQWSIGHCHRVGRDAIRLELKKLYEGTPDREIRHWHGHAIAPSAQLEGAEALRVRNVAIRARELVSALTAVGERLADLGAALQLPTRTGADFVGLDCAFLDYNGWWKGPFVEPVTRHSPIAMERSAFLGRCLDIDKLAIEPLAERHLRPMVRALGVTDGKLDSWRGLKLLDRIAYIAQVANSSGLSLAKSGPEIAARLERDGTDPVQPLRHLFAISDLRQVEGHRKPDADALIAAAAGRLGLDVRSASGGWGSLLDGVYDGAIEDLSALERTLAAALAQIEGG